LSQSEVDEVQHFCQVSSLNKNPLNQACLNHLTPENESQVSLHCLSLGRQAASKLDDPEERYRLESVLDSLDDREPDKAEAWLVKEEGGPGFRVSPEQLKKASRAQAERLILDALLSSLTEHT
jgi:hypothetical protein